MIAVEPIQGATDMSASGMNHFMLPDADAIALVNEQRYSRIINNAPVNGDIVFL